MNFLRRLFKEKLILEFDRYKADDLLQQLDTIKPTQVNDGTWEYTFDHPIAEFEVYLPDLEGAPCQRSYRNMELVLRKLNFLDNSVQSDNIEKYKHGTVSADSHKMYIGRIILSEEPHSIGYFCSHVNSEWDAIIHITDDHQIEPMNFNATLHG